MALTISIDGEVLSASRTYQDSQQAIAALLLFYTAKGIGPDDASPQEKLEGVLDWCVGEIVAAAVQNHVDSNVGGLVADGATLYAFNQGDG